MIDPAGPKHRESLPSTALFCGTAAHRSPRGAMANHPSAILRARRISAAAFFGASLMPFAHEDALRKLERHEPSVPACRIILPLVRPIHAPSPARIPKARSFYTRDPVCTGHHYERATFRWDDFACCGMHLAWVLRVVGHRLGMAASRLPSYPTLKEESSCPMTISHRPGGLSSRTVCAARPSGHGVLWSF